MKHPSIENSKKLVEITGLEHISYFLELLPTLLPKISYKKRIAYLELKWNPIFSLFIGVRVSSPSVYTWNICVRTVFKINGKKNGDEEDGNKDERTKRK